MHSPRSRSGPRRTAMHSHGGVVRSPQVPRCIAIGRGPDLDEPRCIDPGGGLKSPGASMHCDRPRAGPRPASLPSPAMSSEASRDAMGCPHTMLAASPRSPARGRGTIRGSARLSRLERRPVCLTERNRAVASRPRRDEKSTKIRGREFGNSVSRPYQSLEATLCPAKPNYRTPSPSCSRPAVPVLLCTWRFRRNQGAQDGDGVQQSLARRILPGLCTDLTRLSPSVPLSLGSPPVEPTYQRATPGKARLSPPSSWAPLW